MISGFCQTCLMSNSDLLILSSHFILSRRPRRDSLCIESVLQLLSFFCWWAVTQPSEFDGFVSAQGDFIKDLYAGTLLSDMSQADKENIDKPKMESLEDLLKNLESSDDPEEELLSEEERLEAMMDNLMDTEEDLTDEE